MSNGSARKEAESIAREIARFPQVAVLADRGSIIETSGLSIREGLKLEWMNRVDANPKEGAAGLERFSTGAGIHSNFENI